MPKYKTNSKKTSDMPKSMHKMPSGMMMKNSEMKKMGKTMNGKTMMVKSMRGKMK